MFDTLDSWAKKNKTIFWPLQTMLLILCPDIMLKLLNKDKTTDTSTKEKFLDTLKKALKSKGADMAAICYVDICKASTFVSKSDLSALRYMVPSIGLSICHPLMCVNKMIRNRIEGEIVQSRIPTKSWRRREWTNRC